MEHKGDNKYLSEKGGLSFGVRKTYVCDKEGEGVIPVTLAAENEAETTQGLLLSANFERGMKYSPPDIRTLEKGKLSKDMREILNMYMDKDLMSDEIYEFYYNEEEALGEDGVIIDYDEEDTLVEHDVLMDNGHIPQAHTIEIENSTNNISQLEQM